MGLDDAYGKALESMEQIDPRAMASMSGVAFDGEVFAIPIFNHVYTIRLPRYEVSEAGADAPAPKMLAILLMHYLTQADSAPVTSHWIAYRDLPGARLFEQKFANLVSRPMIECFGNNIDGFRQSALALGGQPMEGKGDAAFRFKALPRVPIATIFYCGEEGIPPSISILFDASAPHYLPTDDLVILASFMGSFLKGYKN
jgi:hypothetical protein